MIRLIPEFKITDYQKSLHFYVRVLGFEIDYKREEESFAMLNFEGAKLMIDGIDPDDRFIAAKPEFPFGRGISLQIQTEHVDTLYNKVTEKGWPIFLDMEEKWYRANDIEVGNKQFLIQDPDGYVLRFFEDLGERNLTL